MSGSLARINFSITAEDHATVMRALDLSPGKRIVCVCSAGDTPLGLLTSAPDRVDAVDISFPQICLGQLKVAAIRDLSYDDMQALLGLVRDAPRALRCYEALRGRLADRVRDFWDENRDLIARGVLWQGRVQRMLALARRIVAFTGGQHSLEALSEVRTSAEAECFVRKHVDSWRIRLMLRVVFGRFGYRLLYPALGRRHLPAGMTPYDFSVDRLKAVLRRVRVANNPYLYPMVFGRYQPHAVPPYLDRANHETLRVRIDRITFHVADLVSYLTHVPPRTVDAFALCNVIDWIDAARLEELLSAVVAAAAPEARILIFSRAPRQCLPGRFNKVLKSDAELERDLLVSERTGYYESIYALAAQGGRAE